MSKGNIQQCMKNAALLSWFLGTGGSNFHNNRWNVALGIMGDKIK